MDIIEAKIVVLGSQGVGKTSLIHTYTSGGHNKHVSPTIGASFSTHSMIKDNYRIKLQVWDTAGQERFRAMAPMYYRNANAALLVFDISSHSSFVDVHSWVTELKKNISGDLVIVLIGNKTDLESNRSVSIHEAQSYAEDLDVKYFETSAIQNMGIQNAFHHIGEKLVENFQKAQSALKGPNCDIADHEMTISLEQPWPKTGGNQNKCC